MKVYLLKDITSLGHKGDIKDVTLGYAKNFLFPKQLATIATPTLVQQARIKLEKENKEKEKKQAEAKELAEKIQNTHITIPLKFSAEGKEAYAGATTSTITKALAKEGIKITDSQIQLKNPLKEVGDYKVAINLYSDITSNLKVTIIQQK